ncbi:MAG: hypothetical protein M3281_09245 [Chloroflexota bacterium]|nr:hypothetical protein [Chloroflexota bacterium]
MSAGAWFESLADEYDLSFERLEELYRQAQANHQRSTYSYFLELLEEETYTGRPAASAPAGSVDGD